MITKREIRKIARMKLLADAAQAKFDLMRSQVMPRIKGGEAQEDCEYRLDVDADNVRESLSIKGLLAAHPELEPKVRPLIKRTTFDKLMVKSLRPSAPQSSGMSLEDVARAAIPSVSRRA